MRAHYLVSPAVGSGGVLLLLLWPFGDAAWTIALPFTALPYYFLYGRDLVRTGYGWADLPRVYALNLLLIPVNLGGVLKSLQQAWTGRKTPFGRTPKVCDRTALPLVYLVAEYAIAGTTLFGCAADAASARYGHALFALANALFFVYGLARFVGFRASWRDARAALVQWLRDGRAAGTYARASGTVATEAVAARSRSSTRA
jgi:hypothetical protein